MSTLKPGYGAQRTSGGPWVIYGPSIQAAITFTDENEAINMVDALAAAYRAGEEHAKREIRLALGIDTSYR